MWTTMPNDRRLFSALMAALITLAWLALFIWGESPYGRFLSHEELGQTGENGAYLLLFVGGWTLMTVAMMLPTSLPLVTLFYALTRKHSERSVLVGLLIGGYLGVWMLFGAVAHLGDWGVHEAVKRSGWLEANSWIIGAATIALAGLYQFTPLKYYCLEKCRSPLSFIMSHWRGRGERSQAFWLGMHHGLFCVGCCWTLMVMMFAVGVGSLGWMLGLGAVMAVEKNMSWGKVISTPVGTALLLWALALVVGNVPVLH
jgi:predicted metal-binding membrane protein